MATTVCRGRRVVRNCRRGNISLRGLKDRDLEASSVVVVVFWSGTVVVLATPYGARFW